MPLPKYQQKPESKGYHDLTDAIKPPDHLGRLLSLSRKFITQRPRAPIHHYNTFIARFKKDVRAKYLFHEDNSAPPRLHCRNDEFQPDPVSAPVEEALQHFQSDLFSNVTSKFASQPRATNLTKQQQQLLTAMSDHPTLMVIGSDKNLGQCVIERAKYEQLACEHLKDNETYQQITESEANDTLSDAASTFFEITNDARDEYNVKIRNTCFEESDEEHARRMVKKTSRHSQFCTLAKIHKNTNPAPTRPVAGAAGNPLFSMSKMLDSILQPLLKHLPTYCSNSNQVIHQVSSTVKQLK